MYDRSVTEQQYQQSALVPFLGNLESLGFTAGTYRWEATFVQKAIEVLREASTNRPLMSHDHPAPITLLKKAIRKDYYPLVRALIDIRTPVDSRVNSESPLELACVAGSCEIFDAVLRCVNIAVINDGEGGENPGILGRLIEASSYSNSRSQDSIQSQKLSTALEYGVSPHARANYGEFPHSPVIVLAARRRKYDIVDHLRKAGADILARDRYGWDAVNYYLWNGNVNSLRGITNDLETASYDWTRGVSVLMSGKLETTVWQGCTALHLAARSGSTEVMDYLLQEGRCANVNVTSTESSTPLHVVSYKGYIEAIEFLVAHGADVNAIDDKGNRPIDLALMNGMIQAVKLLWQLGSGAPKGGNITQDQLELMTNDSEAGNKILVSNLCLVPVKPLKIALMELESCLKEGDLAGCQALVADGCLLDRPMPSCGRCDVLTYAVVYGWEALVVWLLSIGCTVKICRCIKHKAPSTIHAAVQSHELSNSCLYQLLDKALETGHSWHSHPLSPLHLASLQSSTSALGAILDHVANHVDAYWTLFTKSLRKGPLPQDKADFKEFLVNSPAGRPGQSTKSNILAYDGQHVARVSRTVLLPRLPLAAYHPDGHMAAIVEADEVWCIAEQIWQALYGDFAELMTHGAKIEEFAK
ncbi:ankyrin repeat-containing domain protein [Xylaria arbuscula]|nr:ankyrin repeat-containing domain protein [Xylaria arbuscula]